jgi:LPXTG-motif cell wall-anchored protein
VEEISVDGVPVEDAACIVNIGNSGDNVVTITNTTTETNGYELPETGSSGGMLIYTAGVALLGLGAALMYMKRRERKEGKG